MKKYENNEHTLYHGDALNVLETEIQPGSVDLVFADPPYNIGKCFGDFHDKWPSDDEYAEWCYKWLTICIEKLSPDGSMYVMTSTQAMPYFDIFLRDKILIMSRIVWCYDSSGMQARKYYGSMYEPILFCVKNDKNYTFNSDDILVEAKTGAKRKLIDYRKPVPTPYNTRKVPGNVWDFPRVRYRMDEYEEHPSQKPEALLERIIRASSNVGDVVLDPFAGTFTTNAVAQKLDRKSIGIERSDEYIEIGLRRVLGHCEHNGKKLKRPKKSTKRKNANGVKGFHDTNKESGDLFSASR